MYASLNLLSVVLPKLAGRARLLRWIFPIAFLSLSRFVTLLAGVGVVLSSIAAYEVWNVFRPVKYRPRARPAELARAQRIVSAHGRSALDHFKAQSDKSLFFSPSGESVLAYRVGGPFAVVLGDPVGPEREIESIVAAFAAFCAENDWGLAFYQTLPDFLPIYLRLGFKKLKLGDDAIVDLRKFSVQGRAGKDFRSGASRLSRAGVTIHREEPPLSRELVAQLIEVADEWQRIPGRRERQFALGRFDAEYVRTTPVFVASDSSGRVVAFVNTVPSYRRGEAAMDLMRRRPDAPNGVMDVLLAKILEWDRDHGFERFTMGMAPMAGFAESEHASTEERAIHHFFQKLNFLFSFKGLRAYKAKFATDWEPRYVIYRTELDLARLALALARISEKS